MSLYHAGFTLYYRMPSICCTRQKAELAKEQEGVPDEDGWITVTKKTKKKVVQRTEKKQQWLKAKAARKRKLKQHANFYTFQIKQSKRDRKF